MVINEKNKNFYISEHCNIHLDIYFNEKSKI
jgi:hypothetical protein